MVLVIKIGNPIKPQKNVQKPDQNLYRCVQESLPIFTLFGQKTNFNYIMSSSQHVWLVVQTFFIK